MTTTPVAAKALIGRGQECAELDALVAEVRAGGTRVLGLRGEAGVGKTALLQYLGRQAVGCTVVRATGVESEIELAYAGLHQLCAPLLSGLQHLPTPQRDALGAAFGLSIGPSPDRFMVGLAVLALLSDTARERPLVCLVDDAQWLDRASADTLAFVARRLEGTRLALVATMRPSGDDQPVWDLPVLDVGALGDHDARILLRSVVPGPIDDEVMHRLLAEADGNPLALLELHRDLTPEQLAGGFGMPEVRSLRGRLEQSYARRIDALPAATRRLLLIAAAETRQDPVLIWRAATRLRIEVSDAGPAVGDGLVDFGGEVRFRHPLVRSTVYRTARADERRLVHGALAEATNPGIDPDYRAWHLAHAAAGLDEAVAAELDRSAGRAQARGGFAAAAAFRERAAALTPDPTVRAERALGAARCKFQAGSPERALRLLPTGGPGVVDDLVSARVQLLRAQIAAAMGHASHAPLLDAARRLEALDGELAAETYRDAFYAAFLSGRLARGDGMLEVATAVREWVSRVPGPAEHLPVMTRALGGLASVIGEGFQLGAPALRRALAELRDEPMCTEAAMGWLPLAARMAQDVWDDELWALLTQRMTEVARGHGLLRVLPVALNQGIALELFAGRLSAAQALADEHAVVSAATARTSPSYGELVIAAWRGSDEKTAAARESDDPGAAARREGQWVTARGWANAMLHNGHGRYDEALEAAEEGAARPHELGLASWSMVELVEAASHAGVPERARAAVDRLTEVADACGTDWSLGIAARSRALVTDGRTAEAGFREALERLSRTRVRWGLARTHLVYGEWLRREGRRIDAREELTAAHDMLDGMGAAAFAERARRELAATGATARRRSVDALVELTEQEAQIARLAAEGRTNPQIAGELYISSRTVEWHLRKIYAKLGIASRKELGRALAGPDARRPA